MKSALVIHIYITGYHLLFSHYVCYQSLKCLWVEVKDDIKNGNEKHASVNTAILGSAGKTSWHAEDSLKGW